MRCFHFPCFSWSSHSSKSAFLPIEYYSETERQRPTLVPRRLFDWNAMPTRTIPPLITITGTRVSDAWPQSGQKSLVSSLQMLEVMRRREDYEKQSRQRRVYTRSCVMRLLS